jgi:hypothetical protein
MAPITIYGIKNCDTMKKVRPVNCRPITISEACKIVQPHSLAKPKLAIRSDPALSSDSRHAAELAHIVGDDDQPLAAGMTTNLHVVRAAGRSRPLQLCPNLAVVRSRFGLERQNVQTRHEMLDGCQVIDSAC